MKRLLLLAWLFPILWPMAAAKAQSVVFLVRHAETASAENPKDPELSAAGRERAENLAKTLADAGVVAVFATEYRRTQQTAAPVARAAGVEVTVLPARESASSLATRSMAGTPQGNVLVVGHSNTVPEILRALGVSSVPMKIAESEYDRLFVVTPGTEPRLIQLHYGK